VKSTSNAELTAFRLLTWAHPVVGLIAAVAACGGEPSSGGADATGGTGTGTEAAPAQAAGAPAACAAGACQNQEASTPEAGRAASAANAVAGSNAMGGAAAGQPAAAATAGAAAGEGAAAGASGAAPSVPQGPAMPGASSIGDEDFPDYGNGGYDVGHYDLVLHYDPSNDKLDGTATITLTPTEHLSSLNLDFVLTVKDVMVDGMPAKFERKGHHEVVITPAASLPAGTEVKVAVTYEGTPSSVRVSDIGFGAWFRTADGVVGAGAPENAWWWFPSNDHPTDKATFDVAVTVPDGVTAISNGVMVAPPTAAEAGWQTWTWKSSMPQQPNLALLVIGEYDMTETKSESGLPIIVAYSKRIDAEAARAAIEKTEAIVKWEESVFGPYPFEALGAVVGPSDGITYALETQTRPVYPISYFRGGGESVVAHENAHQWFGDSCAIKRWKDVWLSEGFATYAEWLYSEAHGNGTAQALFDTAYARYGASDPFWQVVVGDPGKARVYDNAVYQRGAMTLHQLRVAVGDESFYKILRTWTETRRHGNGSIEDFRDLSESTSGKQLDELFDAWLFKPGKPAVSDANPNPGPLPRSWATIDATQAKHRPLWTPPAPRIPH
jgi:aminopeptidase N